MINVKAARTRDFLDNYHLFPYSVTKFRCHSEY